MQTYYDILQAAIVKMEEQRTSAGAASVAAGAEGQEWVNSPDYVAECTLGGCCDASDGELCLKQTLGSGSE